MNAFAIFQQAQKNLIKNPSSEKDQFVVDLWNASKNLHTKNTELRQQLDASKMETHLADMRASEYARKMDMLESKSQKPTVTTVFNAAAWFAAQEATAVAGSTDKPLAS